MNTNYEPTQEDWDTYKKWEQDVEQKQEQLLKYIRGYHTDERGM